MTSKRGIGIEPETTDAVLFDLDGVITSTADLHARAWKETFDALLRARAEERGEDLQPFTIAGDYPEHVDGKPRERGIRDFLASRGIVLPEGERGDPPGLQTVAALAERKNRRFHELLDEQGVDTYEDALDLLEALDRAGIAVGLFSASRNARRMLAAAGLADRFEVVVDGNVAAEEGLEGKPAPATLLEAARRMLAAPERTVVVEDSQAGVEAGRRGGFATVVGVDRVHHAQALAASGADVVVDTLDRLQVPTRRPEELPNALEAGEIHERVRRAAPVVFLDYDGTLSPIVERPEAATISEEMREAIAALADRCTVAVVSGRDLDDVRQRVGLPDLFYAGSHGFEILSPDGDRIQHEAAAESQRGLADAERELEHRLTDVEGVLLEPKRFSLAVHDRRVHDAKLPRVRRAVAEVLDDHPELRVSPGKRVHDLQPDVDWHKGRAVEHLLGELDVDRQRTPIVYVGDDVTDEDAFRKLPEAIRVLVRDGRQATHADHALDDTRQVQTFLEQLTGTLEEVNP